MNVIVPVKLLSATDDGIRYEGILVKLSIVNRHSPKARTQPLFKPIPFCIDVGCRVTAAVILVKPVVSTFGVFVGDILAIVSDNKVELGNLLVIDAIPRSSNFGAVFSRIVATTDSPGFATITGTIVVEIVVVGMTIGMTIDEGT